MLRKMWLMAVAMLAMAVVETTGTEAQSIDILAPVSARAALSDFDEGEFTGATFLEPLTGCGIPHSAELMLLKKGEKPTKITVLLVDRVRPGTRTNFVTLVNPHICTISGVLYDLYHTEEE